jgi:hypothetical protein
MGEDRAHHRGGETGELLPIQRIKGGEAAMGRFLRRYKPSPAAVLAFIALTVALAGSATALQGNAGDTATGSAAKKTRAYGLRLWAVIDANGSLVRGGGVDSATRADTGAYHIVFKKNVRECAYLATLGRTGAEVADPGEIGTGGLPETVKGIWIRTRDSAGNLADRSFHVGIIC